MGKFVVGCFIKVDFFVSKFLIYIIFYLNVYEFKNENNVKGLYKVPFLLSKL